MTKPQSCAGCTRSRATFKRLNTRSTWCERYHRPAVERCIDYQPKGVSIETALTYYKRTSIK